MIIKVYIDHLQLLLLLEIVFVFGVMRSTLKVKMCLTTF